jgi:hypothetical protein
MHLSIHLQSALKGWMIEHGSECVSRFHLSHSGRHHGYINEQIFTRGGPAGFLQLCPRSPGRTLQSLCTLQYITVYSEDTAEEGHRGGFEEMVTSPLGDSSQQTTETVGPVVSVLVRTRLVRIRKLSVCARPLNTSLKAPATSHPPTRRFQIIKHLRGRAPQGSFNAI